MVPGAAHSVRLWAEKNLNKPWSVLGNMRSINWEKEKRKNKGKFAKICPLPEIQ